jgi:hypothetical protein
MGIAEFFKSRTGVIIISVIWGLGLSTIFRKACEGKNCNVVKYVSPNPQDIAKSVYNYGTDECYQYDAVLTKC